VYRSRTPQRADGAQNPLAEASGYSSPHGAIMRLTFADGSQQTFPEAALDRELSAGIFQRTGRIARIDLDLSI
jgi:hypothetical protein